jgi:hypothetical protein
MKGQFKKRASHRMQAERALTCPFPVGGMACPINMDNQMTIKLFTNRIHLFQARLIGRYPLLAGPMDAGEAEEYTVSILSEEMWYNQDRRHLSPQHATA